MLPAAATLPSRLATLPPSSFAFVMATGIVAIAARQQGLVRASLALFSLNAAAWALLGLLSLLRLQRYPRHMQADLQDHLRSPGFFTAVAGTGVLASGSLALGISFTAAAALAAVAALLWLVVTYGVFAALITKNDKPTLDGGIGGGWLLAVVACQSLALACALLSGHWEQPVRLELNFLALCLWLFAGLLYTCLIGLILYRYLFFRFAPADLTPSYWINMGAMAISTLAGTQLIANAPHAPFLQDLLPFLQGFTVLYWATGTWWLPLLVVLTVWRYGWRRDTVRGNALDWSAVFPLGMYSAATYQMARVLPLPFLDALATVFFWLAVAAWAATSWGGVRKLLDGQRRCKEAPAG